MSISKFLEFKKLNWGIWVNFVNKEETDKVTQLNLVYADNLSDFYLFKKERKQLSRKIIKIVKKDY